jgi:hypothetical protein
MIIVKSLFITSAISFLFGFGFRNITGFWEAFSIAYGLQVVTAFVYSSYKLTTNSDTEQEYDAQIQELLDMSRVTFECPCNKNRMTEEIFVGVDNIFKCEVCGNDIKVDTKIDPVLQTTPVDVKGNSFNSIIEEQEEKEQSYN